MEPYLSYARGVHAHTRVVRESAGVRLPGVDDIREVLLILSASRGGGSLVYDVLSRHPDVVSIGGEHVPQYKMNGFDLDASEDASDAVRSFSPAAGAALAASIAAAVRSRTDRDGTPGDALFACDAVDRLALQWSGARTPAEALLGAVTAAVGRCRAESRAAGWDGRRFLAALARTLPDWSATLPFDPAYTDGHRGYAARAMGPPDPHYCVEEPPFVLPEPRAVPAPAALRRRTLLLKAAVDAYRLPLVSSLFPRARLRIVHLTRNPAAAVNGLCDGWLDRGFFSYNVAAHADLAIPGYSELHPWGRTWWNFEAPPGWQKLATAPLPEVAAHQWAGAHGAILTALADRPGHDVLRVRFEDIVRSPRDRRAALGRILDFAGLRRHAALNGPPPVVMATEPPRRARWRERRELVEPALDSGDIPAVATELGYLRHRQEDWL